MDELSELLKRLPAECETASVSEGLETRVLRRIRQERREESASWIRMFYWMGGATVACASWCIFAAAGLLNQATSELFSNGLLFFLG